MSARPEATNPKPSPLASPEPWNLVVEGYEEIGRKYLGAIFAISAGDASIRSGDEGDRRGMRAWHDSLLLAPAVRHITCLDFSAGMLAQLRRNMATIGATNVEIVEGDGQALPFEDNSFDIGVSMFGLMFFPDRAKGFRRVASRPRTQRPGPGVELGPVGPVVDGARGLCSTSARRRAGTAHEPPVRT